MELESVRIEGTSDAVVARAALHQALADPHRLAMVDALRLSDRTPSELADVTGLGSNHVAFHLDVLGDAGLIERTRSQGDARRRYVSLRWERLGAVEAPQLRAEHVLFVCTHNSARSQLAAALWERRTGRPAGSAGTHPAPQVHRHALAVASRHGLDLAGRTPKGYADLDRAPDLVVSVCDRAREDELPWRAPHLHWSVPDPADGVRRDFERAYDELDRRIDWLADHVAGAA